MDGLGTVPEDLLANALAFLPKLIFSLVLFIVGLVLAGALARLVRGAVARREAGLELELLASKVTRWSIIILASLVALEQVDFNVSAFLAGLGILGFTVGFAIQDVSKNFVAGLLLLLQQPFNIGDGIKVGGFAGTVTSVDLRATGLATIDGREVLIPNAEVFTSAIEKYGRGEQRRVDVAAGVSYESDLEMVERVALEAIAEIPGVLQAPAPSVIFGNLGASTVDLVIYYWIDRTQIGVLRAQDVGIRNIKRAFENANIEMPFPVQTVYLHTEG
jgi:small conductance mechanosensitive channel